MNVGELCIRDIVVLRKDDLVLQAAQLMRQYHVGDIVVVEQPRTEKIPLGILTDRDIVIGLLAEELDPRAVTVGDIMSAELFTASENDDVIETIKRMRNKGVRRIPVVNRNGGLEGILALRDIVIGLLAEELDPRAVTVGDIMSAELLTASENDDVIETIKRMRNKGVRRIPVVNRNGGLEGILALDDLLDFLAEQINDLVSLINREQQLEQTKSA